MVVAMVFIASAILLFGAILGIWYLFRRKDEKDPQ